MRSAGALAIVVGGITIPSADQSSAKLLGRFPGFAAGAALADADAAPPRTGRGAASVLARTCCATTSVSGPIAASRAAVSSCGTMIGFGFI